MAITTFVSDKDKGTPVPGWPDVVGYSVVTYKGAVLNTGEYNGYDDSDFYADVWDDEAGVVKRITYATTRGWTYLNGASVDATPEVREKAAKFYAKRNLTARLERAADDARTPGKGKRVKVIKGRKVPIGTEGTVFWVGPDHYSRHGALRLGLKDDAGATHWTAASNVEVIAPEEFLPDYDLLVGLAEHTGREYAGLR